MLARTFPTIVRPSYIRTRALDLVQEGSDGSFVGRFNIDAVSEIRFLVTFRRTSDGFALYGDAFGVSMSHSLIKDGLAMSKPARQT